MNVERVEIGDAVLYHGDCREVLPTLGRVAAVVADPPYGIFNVAAGEGEEARKTPRQLGAGKLKNRLLNRSNVMWDIAPTPETLDALRGMSDHQIIWGGNYFPLPPARGMLVWDKEQPWENFSQVEIAWTNLECPAAIFRASAVRSIPGKEHPTQKPITLMCWCLDKLPGGGGVVLDPFMGSGTTGVACAMMGRKFIGIEADRGYFEMACRRIEGASAQGKLFVEEPAAVSIQDGLAL